MNTILKMNILPEQFFQAAKLFFPETRLYGIMVKISDLWDLFPSETLRNQVMTLAEQKRMSSFKLEKRRQEWFAGRVCAKTAAQTLIGPTTTIEFQDIMVDNASDGRPMLVAKGLSSHQGLDLSISHSGDFAMAMLATHFCGVDVQKPTETVLRVKEKFCTSAEEAIINTFFQANETATGLNLLWCSKEAIRKTLSYQGVPNFLDLRLDSIKNLSSGQPELYFTSPRGELATICTTLENHALALCVDKGPGNARTP